MNATQSRLMGLLATWNDAEGLPVLSRLADELGLASESGVRKAMEGLIAAGLLERIQVAPNLKIPRLTPQGWAEMRREEIVAGVSTEGDLAPDVAALVPGSRAWPVFPISCGHWLQADASNVEPEYTTTGLTDAREGDYICRIKGDSMVDPNTGAGFREDDRLHMRSGIYPQNGDVVHAEYPHDSGINECTLKIFHLDEKSGTVTLWALNPRYPDIVRTAGEVVIRGKALEVVKRVGRYSRK